jgi:hypothetical protein
LTGIFCIYKIVSVSVVTVSNCQSVSQGSSSDSQRSSGSESKKRLNFNLFLLLSSSSSSLYPLSYTLSLPQPPTHHQTAPPTKISETKKTHTHRS